MRKFVTMTLASLLLAAGVMVSSTNGSYAWEYEFNLAKFCKYHPSSAKCAHPTQHQSRNTTGQWAVGCGIASAGSLMIGTAIKASDKDKKKRRQLTITEAYWHASACPFLLPLALVAQAACPDNKATYQVATLAYAYVDKHPAADQSAFTRAYGEACRTGKLSRATLVELGGLVGFAAAKPVLRVRG